MVNLGLLYQNGLGVPRDYATAREWFEKAADKGDARATAYLEKLRSEATFKSAVDDPSRITKSKAVGALFGLTPKKYQSGEKDVTGEITRAGDEMVRTALYEAANVLLSRITRFSRLKRWGMDIAKRRGSKRAKVALARKIGVILHRMWVDSTRRDPGFIAPSYGLEFPALTG
jgi:Transposase IS116/IS110/IS902 family/Sel1 repeat